MLRFSRIPRLPERMNTLTFLGNFPDTAQLLMPVCAGWQGGGWAGMGEEAAGSLVSERAPESSGASYQPPPCASPHIPSRPPPPPRN